MDNDKISAAYLWKNESDWDQLPPDIQDYFDEILRHNLSDFLLTTGHLRRHPRNNFQLIVIATVISLTTAVGLVLNGTLIVRALRGLKYVRGLERALELNVLVTWFVFQLFCVPILLTHDVLVVKWKLGEGMCRIVPWVTFTIVHVQCLTFLAQSVKHALTHALQARRGKCCWMIAGWNVTERVTERVSERVTERVTGGKCSGAVVSLLIWVISGACAFPVQRQYGVVLYGIHESNQCVNFVSVMEPQRYQKIRLHYFIWLMLLPVIGSLSINCVSRIMHHSRRRMPSYERFNYSNREPDSQLANGLLIYNFILILYFILSWVAFQIMTLFAAYSKVHEWLPQHTLLFNISMTLAYTYPCVMCVLTALVHPLLKFHKGSCFCRNASGRRDPCLENIDVLHLPEIDDDVIVYSRDGYTRDDYLRDDSPRDDYSHDDYTRGDNSRDDTSRDDYSRDDYSRDDYSRDNY